MTIISPKQVSSLSCVTVRCQPSLPNVCCASEASEWGVWRIWATPPQTRSNSYEDPGCQNTALPSQLGWDVPGLSGVGRQAQEWEDYQGQSLFANRSGAGC